MVTGAVEGDFEVLVVAVAPVHEVGEKVAEAFLSLGAGPVLEHVDGGMRPLGAVVPASQ